MNSKRVDGTLAPNGAKDATTDDLQIAKWDKKSPNANVGVVATYDGFFFVDVDDLAAVPSIFSKIPSPFAQQAATCTITFATILKPGLGITSP